MNSIEPRDTMQGVNSALQKVNRVATLAGALEVKPANVSWLQARRHLVQ